MTSVSMCSPHLLASIFVGILEVEGASNNPLPVNHICISDSITILQGASGQRERGVSGHLLGSFQGVGRSRACQHAPQHVAAVALVAPLAGAFLLLDRRGRLLHSQHLICLHLQSNLHT